MSKLQCPFPLCIRTFHRNCDLTRHVNICHGKTATPPPISFPLGPILTEFDSSIEFIAPELPSPIQRKDHKKFHPYLSGDICDHEGKTLPSNTPPPLPQENPSDQNPWFPFGSEAEFRLADLLFTDTEMSQGNINKLLDIWSLYQQQLRQANGCTTCPESQDGPFLDHKNMYSTIDSIAEGGAIWKCMQTAVDENLSSDAPEWQKTSYQVWYRDPRTRRWSDFMSGNFAWRHADKIRNADTEFQKAKGAMLVPVILGADKTTVSVATGHVEYHPLYLTIGNVTNEVRRAHRNAVIPIGFLAIPKSDRKYDKDSKFRIFRKQLYHHSVAAILRSLKFAMTTPVVQRCPDGHFRRIIYDLAAFIADYPEQVYLSGIVQGWCGRALYSDLDGPGDRRTRELDQILREEYGDKGRTLWDNFGIDEHITPFTEDFPRADIHEMLSPDLLHQIIKGCFKDMLVEWCFEYLTIEHGEARANEILDDIDRRLAAVPSFPGLRHFPHGRRFKQWTGDDSKALMKIFLPAVSEYLPSDMMKCLSSFEDFCYLVRRSDIDETSLAEIQRSIKSFQEYRQIFIDTGVREHFSIPRMHAIKHYPFCIMEFGAPNGLCSSITESRHITAVKKPWRRSNCYQALSQMLLTNQRLDKLSALRSSLVKHQFLLPSHPPKPDPFDTESEDIGPLDSGRATADVKLAHTRARNYPRDLVALATHIQQPTFVLLTQEFLRDQLHSLNENHSTHSSDSDSNSTLPHITSKVNVYHSAVAVFYAPSDNSGIRGMKRERIRCTPSWYSAERRDCVLATIDDEKPGFQGLSAARALLFFSFEYGNKVYSCALVHWYNTYGQRRDPKTGLWIVRPAFYDQAGQQQSPCLAVVHLDSLVRGVHLIPVFGSQPIPSELRFHQSLDLFKLFYINKYVDYHANEILF
ncbi:hypothetical protein D9757_009785 [Collybiopsis confluens]|uniref:C2H2-type domain-containing protein n=1 Tax=Collybiopsis confluens TaxID=2823264 RepID=A0A8H5HFN5_9AGAR|nr:hypothetical protein D9757_009785 [Collybiopsis confluens]